MPASIARPNFTAIPTVAWFSTGRTPGYPSSTRFACEFGGAPYAVGDAEKIFDLVASWACTSSPMTVSQVSLFIARRNSGVPVGFALIGMGGAQQARFGEMPADDLQSHRQLLHEPARNGHRGQAREVRTNGVDVVQVHGDGVGGLRSKLEGHRRCCLLYTS